MLCAQALEKVDALINEKKYDEALIILTNIAESDPDQFDNAQQRIRRINMIHAYFNRTADELIETLLYDPGNNEKILSLSSRLFTLENEDSVLFVNFLDKASKIPELNVNRNLIRDVLIKGKILQESGYDIYYNEDNARINQRLTWDNDENAMEYEIVIIDNISLNECFREKTINNFIVVSLHPGNYSVNITPFDFLGFAGEMSEIEIEILRASQPRIEKFIPSVFNLDQRLERVINISGFNLSEESVFFLRNRFNDLHPVSVTILSDTRARIFFNDVELIAGTYEIYIVNPGGIETKAGNFFIGYRKALDAFYKVTFNPIIPIYGIPSEIFGNQLFLSGISSAFEFVSSKRSSINGGVEIGTSIYYLHEAFTIAENTDDWLYNLQSPKGGFALAEANVNIALQKRFLNGRISATIRFGSGMSFFLGLSENDNGLKAHLNGGATILFLLYDIFHLEIGADFTHYFLDDFTAFIKPRIGIAWKF